MAGGSRRAKWARAQRAGRRPPRCPAQPVHVGQRALQASQPGVQTPPGTAFSSCLAGHPDGRIDPTSSVRRPRGPPGAAPPGQARDRLSARKQCLLRRGCVRWCGPFRGQARRGTENPRRGLHPRARPGARGGQPSQPVQSLQQAGYPGQASGGHGVTVGVTVISATQAQRVLRQMLVHRQPGPILIAAVHYKAHRSISSTQLDPRSVTVQAPPPSDVYPDAAASTPAAVRHVDQAAGVNPQPGGRPRQKCRQAVPASPHR